MTIIPSSQFPLRPVDTAYSHTLFARLWIELPKQANTSRHSEIFEAALKWVPCFLNWEKEHLRNRQTVNVYLSSMLFGVALRLLQLDVIREELKNEEMFFELVASGACTAGTHPTFPTERQVFEKHKDHLKTTALAKRVLVYWQGGILGLMRHTSVRDRLRLYAEDRFAQWRELYFQRVDIDKDWLHNPSAKVVYREKVNFSYPDWAVQFLETLADKRSQAVSDPSVTWHLPGDSNEGDGKRPECVTKEMIFASEHFQRSQANPELTREPYVQHDIDSIRLEMIQTQLDNHMMFRKNRRRVQPEPSSDEENDSDFPDQTASPQPDRGPTQHIQLDHQLPVQPNSPRSQSAQDVTPNRSPVQETPDQLLGHRSSHNATQLAAQEPVRQPSAESEHTEKPENPIQFVGEVEVTEPHEQQEQQAEAENIISTNPDSQLQPRDATLMGTTHQSGTPVELNYDSDLASDIFPLMLPPSNPELITKPTTDTWTELKNLAEKLWGRTSEEQRCEAMSSPISRQSETISETPPNRAKWNIKHWSHPICVERRRVSASSSLVRLPKFEIFVFSSLCSKCTTSSSALIQESALHITVLASRRTITVAASAIALPNVNIDTLVLRDCLHLQPTKNLQVVDVKLDVDKILVPVLWRIVAVTRNAPV